MIQYAKWKWSIPSLVYYRGSHFGWALLVALPCSVLGVFIHVAIGKRHAVENESWTEDLSAAVVGGYSTILGFLLVFRAQRAYSRWWEGGTLLQQLRGEWFNAYSSLLAFSSSSKDKEEDVNTFSHILMRLMSLLYCSALQQVSARHSDIEFEVLDPDCIHIESLEFLEEVEDRVEVVLQWIQRLIVESIYNGILPIPAPILSRVFQEYSRGIVNLNNARKIAEFPFPFPLVQLMHLLLAIQWFITPIVCGLTLRSPQLVGLITFTIIFVFWNVHYISAELEMPFGTMENDLPLQGMQIDMNESLLTLLQKKAQHPPVFQNRIDIKKSQISNGARLSACSANSSAPQSVQRRTISRGASFADSCADSVSKKASLKSQKSLPRVTVLNTSSEGVRSAPSSASKKSSVSMSQTHTGRTSGSSVEIRLLDPGAAQQDDTDYSPICPEDNVQAERACAQGLQHSHSHERYLAVPGLIPATSGISASLASEQVIPPAIDGHGVTDLPNRQEEKVGARLNINQSASPSSSS